MKKSYFLLLSKLLLGGFLFITMDVVAADELDLKLIFTGDLPKELRLDSGASKAGRWDIVAGFLQWRENSFSEFNSYTVSDDGKIEKVSSRKEDMDDLHFIPNLFPEAGEGIRFSKPQEGTKGIYYINSQGSECSGVTSDANLSEIASMLFVCNVLFFRNKWNAHSLSFDLDRMNYPEIDSLHYVGNNNVFGRGNYGQDCIVIDCTTREFRKMNNFYPVRIKNDEVLDFQVSHHAKMGILVTSAKDNFRRDENEQSNFLALLFDIPTRRVLFKREFEGQYSWRNFLDMRFSPDDSKLLINHMLSSLIEVFRISRSCEGESYKEHIKVDSIIEKNASQACFLDSSRLFVTLDEGTYEIFNLDN